MQDYLRRFLIAGIMAVCVGLLFLGVKNVQAETIPLQDITSQWMWPSEGVLSDSFGTRNGEHKGIDIAGPIGTPVYAVDKGTVTKSYYSDTYGHVVFVKHDYGMETIYAHLQERAVQEGQHVGQGEVIGKMGNTGDSSGVHLHFEVHMKEWTFDKKNAVNPMTALGFVEIGQAVAAVRHGEHEGAVETSTRLLSSERFVGSEQNSLPSDSRTETAGEKYIVQQGDTLWSIARMHSTTVQSLQNQNGLQNEAIFIGQVLVIPMSSASVYIVQKGDTLASIARKNHISITELSAMNGLKHDLIKPQQRLVLKK
nr:peptidoglycan DD-metalloendopeptidase family protein [uncultured Bacillus sp.]